MKHSSSTPTPHITAEQGDIAKIVIMPGDPLRARYIAENFLEDWKQVNSVRNMLMFTGKYKGIDITIAGSGMGMPSIGIYSYELYKFYGVECIIRVGSCGSYRENIKIFDVLNVESALSESTFALIAANIKENVIQAPGIMKDIIKETAMKIDAQLDNSSHSQDFSPSDVKTTLVDKINLKGGMIHSSDVFYRYNPENWQQDKMYDECLAVEMESFALFANAIQLKKDAACILTVSDSVITYEAISAEARQTSFNKMMILALESAANYPSHN